MGFLAIFQTASQLIYLFVHHLHALCSFELRVFVPNLNVSFCAIGFIGGLVSFLGVFLLSDVQDLQCLFDGGCHFVSLECAIWVIFEEHLLVLVVLVLTCLLLALFDSLAYL